MLAKIMDKEQYGFPLWVNKTGYGICTKLIFFIQINLGGYERIFFTIFIFLPYQIFLLLSFLPKCCPLNMSMNPNINRHKHSPSILLSVVRAEFCRFSFRLTLALYVPLIPIQIYSSGKFHLCLLQHITVTNYLQMKQKKSIQKVRKKSGSDA